MPAKRNIAEMSLFASKELATGWEFKNSEEDAWLPVAKVPTVIHLDLMHNKKYILD
jgi:beta-mannosidase